MSLDNVLAIAAAAHGSSKLIIFGIVLSVPIVMFGAGFLLKVLERFPLLVWGGAGLLGWVAGEMMASDPFVAGQARNLIQPGWLEHGLAFCGAALVLATAFAIEIWRQWRADQADPEDRESNSRSD